MLNEDELRKKLHKILDEFFEPSETDKYLNELEDQIIVLFKSREWVVRLAELKYAETMVGKYGVSEHFRLRKAELQPNKSDKGE